MSTCLLRDVLFTVSVALAIPAVIAQTAFPSRPVTLVVPFGPGGATDVLARSLADQLSRSWSVPVLVNNRTGGNGIIATQEAVRAPADGHTILLHLTGIVQNVSLYKQLPYDPFTDLVPVTQIGSQPMGLAVSSQSPHKTLESLLAALAKEPDKGSYGSFGAGSSGHIYGELLRSLAGLRLPHVAYRGEVAMIPDIASGRVEMGFVSAGTAAEHRTGNSLRILAVTGSVRLTTLPEVPTMSEAGFNDFDLVGWFGLFVPRGTPRIAVERIAADTQVALSNPSMVQRMRQLSVEPKGTSPAKFEMTIREDFRRWDSLIKRFSISLE